MKRILSVIISLAILLSMTGVTGFAATTAAKDVTAVAFEDSTAVTIDVKDTYNNPAKTTPEGGKITYRSSDTKVATVNSRGRVSGVEAGIATITATCGTESDSYTVTVEGSGILKPKRVRIEASQKWVRVDRTIQLEAVVSPDEYDYDEIEWYTLDYDIVSIDDYGEVTGLKPGIAHISVYVYTDGATRRREVGSADIEIEVRGSTTSYSTSYSEYDPDNTRSSSSSSTVAKQGMIPTKTVNEAVKKALKSGTTTDTTFKNYTSISTVSLESAAAEMQLGGGVVLLNFDTLSSSGKTVEGRLTINPRAYKHAEYDDPLQMGHSINVTLSKSDVAVLEVRDLFNKYYKNDILVIKTGQKGKYGMSVTGMVKVGDAFAKAKQSNLRLYTYDPKSGKSGSYRLVKNPNISIDDNKNLHFTTDTGNYLIVSNGVLERK